MFSGNRQHDAHELLHTIISAMRYETWNVNRNTIANEKNPHKRYLKGIRVCVSTINYTNFTEIICFYCYTNLNNIFEYFTFYKSLI